MLVHGNVKFWVNVSAFAIFDYIVQHTALTERRCPAAGSVAQAAGQREAVHRLEGPGLP